VSTRIGIDNSGDAAHWPLRFYLRGNVYVGASRAAVPAAGATASRRR